MNSSRVALVTGASGGIGGATARLFLKKGWRVFGTYRTDPESVPDSCEPLQVDFARPREAARQLKQDLSSRHNGLDVVVHAAGPTRDKTFKKMTTEQWNHIRRTHLDSAFHLARHLHPLLESAASAESPCHYVLFTSFAALRGSFGQSNYAAAKSALMGFTMSLAREWGPEIQVNIIRPPLTESKMTAGIPDSVMPRLEQMILNRRVAAPDQTADMVGFICEQTNLTGQVLSADHRIHSPWS